MLFSNPQLQLLIPYLVNPCYLGSLIDSDRSLRDLHYQALLGFLRSLRLVFSDVYLGEWVPCSKKYSIYIKATILPNIIIINIYLLISIYLLIF